MRLHVNVSDRCKVAVTLPTSKSLSARALVLEALTDAPWTIADVAQCDDTRAIAHALEVHGYVDRIDVGDAGTAMRFLTAYMATRTGIDVVLDGSERMRQRPIGPLVDALRQWGASITYLGEEGFPPLRIAGRALRGREIGVRADVSSQFISALMMIAPVAGGATLHLEGDIVSQPYIAMTSSLMQRAGVPVTTADGGHTLIIPAGRYHPCSMRIEGDWSAASYWIAWAALLPATSFITLKGLACDSVQGDAQLLEWAPMLGVQATWAADDVLQLRGGLPREGHRELDLRDTPDLMPTLAVVQCLLDTPYRLSGLSTLRHKESDRVACVQAQLRKLGYQVTVSRDGDIMEWNGAKCPATAAPIVIDPAGDHRLAMAFSLAAARCDALVIDHAEVVEKSYPDYWQHLRQAGFTLTSI